ncbi:VapC toxin family PIN domain ribonuclease [Pseudoduganella sp. FT26W]|uniref:VapC toxin family PIN domain ribonuclease n=2 Tax=Duganella aquatilis TaxID=2666082 RepID=A0A844DGU5_9BURK|nr:VapC toxin family PIN domain ribonuclease [Duganella aquatilis]
MYLIDTNVLSEARKGRRCNPGVMDFFRLTSKHNLFIAAQTVGEIRCGLENLRYRGRSMDAARLEAWLDLILNDYADRQLSFDIECAQVWGRLMCPQPQHIIDKQIAAIALVYDLTVVTRNISDFLSTGVRLQNPFV